MNIYVSNLPYSATEEELETLFSNYGPVDSVKIIVDHETQRSRGFGFVEMETEEDGKAAIEALDGYELQGRALSVRKALPRKPKGGGGGYR